MPLAFTLIAAAGRRGLVIAYSKRGAAPVSVLGYALRHSAHTAAICVPRLVMQMLCAMNKDLLSISRRSPLIGNSPTALAHAGTKGMHFDHLNAWKKSGPNKNRVQRLPFQVLAQKVRFFNEVGNLNAFVGQVAFVPYLGRLATWAVINMQDDNALFVATNNFKVCLHTRKITYYQRNRLSLAQPWHYCNVCLENKSFMPCQWTWWAYERLSSVFTLTILAGEAWTLRRFWECLEEKRHPPEGIFWFRQICLASVRRYWRIQIWELLGK